MDRFSNAREAKEFLISRVVEEAQHENVPLTEVERKMLYFSEAGSMPQDMVEASDAFGREYDQDVYEKKITSLIRKARNRARKEHEYDVWWNAIRLLKKQDHYILVMIRAARLRPPHDDLKLLVAGLAVAGVMLLAIFVSAKYNIDLGRYAPSRDALRFYIWAGAISMAIGYVLVRWILGAQRFDDLTGKLLEKLFRSRDLES